jgi:TolB-like protein/Flp pilus assembly protein TadD
MSCLSCEATLTDFGIALAVQGAGGDRLTGTGLSLGTPSYMSPEQAAGDRNVDARSDIYAVGAVTYEMLAGEPPVTGATVQAMIAKLMTERPTSLRVLRDTVPPAVDAAVMRALAKAPSDRFSTAREFADALTSEPTAPTRELPARAHRWTPLVLGPALLLAVLIAAHRLRQHAETAGGAPVDAIRSIAVLPLDNYSADSTQEYFAEGMTDELTSNLATISQLRVTSRGSAMQFKGANRPATPVIAKALNVDAVVEGSVTRVGDEVRINAQLIDARVDRHIWAQTFERKSSDVLALQAEMASSIASAINVQLTPREQSRFAAAPTVDPAAHDAYLKGRYFFNRPSDENLQKAMAQFDTAIALSPDFAPAYSGLSDTYAWAASNEGFISSADAKPKTRETAQRAVALDSMWAEAHTSLGVYQAWFEYDWDGSEREFKRAIARNPNYAFAHDQLGLMLAIVGRFAEAIAEGQRAMALDPLSPSILIDAAGVFEYSGDVSQARALNQKAEELDPNFFFPIHDEAAMALHANDFSEAIAKLQQARTMGAPPFVTAYLAYALGKSGDRAGAMATLAEVKRVSPEGEVAPFNMALLYLGLGDHARALDDLERAYTESSQQLVWLNDEPIWNPLRSEPRFIALMKKLHFLK